MDICVWQCHHIVKNIVVNHTQYTYIWLEGKLIISITSLMYLEACETCEFWFDYEDFGMKHLFGLLDMKRSSCLRAGFE